MAGTAPTMNRAQRIGELHALLRTIKSLGDEVGALCQDARKARERAHGRRCPGSGKAVDGPWQPFAFEKERCAVVLGNAEAGSRLGGRPGARPDSESRIGCYREGFDDRRQRPRLMPLRRRPCGSRRRAPRGRQAWDALLVSRAGDDGTPRLMCPECVDIADVEVAECPLLSDETAEFVCGRCAAPATPGCVRSDLLRWRRRCYYGVGSGHGRAGTVRPASMTAVRLG